MQVLAVYAQTFLSALAKQIARYKSMYATFGGVVQFHPLETLLFVH